MMEKKKEVHYVLDVHDQLQQVRRDTSDHLHCNSPHNPAETHEFLLLSMVSLPPPRILFFPSLSLSLSLFLSLSLCCC